MACSGYSSVRISCGSAFTTLTNCVAAGEPGTLCAGGLGTYSYACVGDGSSPFEQCTVTDAVEVTTPYYCCY